MSVTNLSLKAFSLFREAEFAFSPGLNVLIGANATGKSHVMKLLYSILKIKAGGANHTGRDSGAPEMTALKLQEKLQRVFRPDGDRIGRLVTRGRGRNHAGAALTWGDSEFAFTLTTLGKVAVERDTLPPVASCLFLPTRELLSMYPGFIAAYEGRELEFDDTYYDLSLALSAAPLRGPRLSSAIELLKPLETVLLWKVALERDRFYLQSKGEGKLEASLAAEGLRKLGSLMYLITNGSLPKNGVLFWDEPEANLNPKLVSAVAALLLRLAGAGVQVFIATHDFLLSNELSLAAEYDTAEGRAAKTKFFCLSRERSRGPVHVDSGAMLGDLAANPILDEFAAHYNREQALFQTSPSSAAEGRDS